MRTNELVNAADASADILSGCFSFEMWGGATFDVAMRFLRECPWDRLEQLREKVPNVPFQMLLRGANAVGYTNYPDNAVHKFCDVAVKRGMDVFRSSTRSTTSTTSSRLRRRRLRGRRRGGGHPYSGDISDPSKTKFTLDYYLELARQLVAADIHVLAIKDMAGPAGRGVDLVAALRREFLHLPITCTRTTRPHGRRLDARGRRGAPTPSTSPSTRWRHDVAAVDGRDRRGARARRPRDGLEMAELFAHRVLGVGPLLVRRL